MGRELDVEVGPVAHGGHCVARHEGRVVFVRHALPGESVRIRITEGDDGSRFLRADAVVVHTASPDRVPPRCPASGPGGCGGCDFQHASPEAGRRLKGAVVREQVRRLAGLDLPVEVEPVPGDDAGLRWRTRVEFAVGRDGRPGLRQHRSHTVLPVQDCPIAVPEVVATGVLERTWPGERAVDVVVPRGERGVLVPVPSGTHEDRPIVERVESRHLTRDFAVSARGFWQVHPGAAATFVDRVLDGLAPRPGERALDLYAGVGLFAAALGEAVGPTGAVSAVEADRPACASAEHNLSELPHVDVHARPTLEWLQGAGLSPGDVDLVVLDPPRSGAGREVMELLCALRPRAIAYVACDPAALARDLATASAQPAAYGVASLHAYDAFPMTHHVECVAILTPAVVDLS